MHLINWLVILACTHWFELTSKEHMLLLSLLCSYISHNQWICSIQADKSSQTLRYKWLTIRTKCICQSAGPHITQHISVMLPSELTTEDVVDMEASGVVSIEGETLKLQEKVCVTKQDSRTKMV